MQNGPHAGTRISRLPFDYIRWLTGDYLVSGQRVNRFDRLVSSVWYRRTMRCRCPKEWHDAECFKLCVRATEADTRAACLAAVSSGRAEFPGAAELREWATVASAEPDAFAAARSYIADKRLCWECGSVIRRPGTDWASRMMHRKCWDDFNSRHPPNWAEDCSSSSSDSDD
jgi:hypothetical protein